LLWALAGEVVTVVSPASFDFACASQFEALGGGAVRLHFVAHIIAFLFILILVLS